MDLVRDSTIGQFVNFLSGGRLLPYADQRPGYAIPSQFLPTSSRPVSVTLSPGVKTSDETKKEADSPSNPPVSNKRASTFSVIAIDVRPPSRISNGRPSVDQSAVYIPSQFMVPASESEIALAPIMEPTSAEESEELKKREVSSESLPIAVKRESVVLAPVNESRGFPDTNLVGWDGENDSDNPRNWSFGKRVFVSSCISLLTFSVYIGSPIYTASIPGIMEEFNVSLVYATLGLTLYIVGYGVGPLFFAPLQEIPSIGRTPVFIYTLFIFVVLQIPIILATNVRVIFALRFLTGVFGGLAPATGAATMADMFPLQQLPYIMGIWSLFAIAGPIVGPITGSFAAAAHGWRWPMYELLWLSGFCLIFLALFLPETYEPTILLKRARRLRKLSGNDDLYTAAERLQESQTAGDIMYEALVRPFVLMAEPVMVFANVYLGFVYSLFYLWFESFPLVFTDVYQFGFGASTLPFIGYIVTGALTVIGYSLYQKYHITPRYIRAAMENKIIQPEIRLEIGLMGSIFIPVSMLVFGFTSKANIHWIVPVIGASLYLPGLLLEFQSIMLYIATSYTTYAGSALAGNGLFRSAMAGVFPLFGRAYFVKLGLGPGSAILAGISLVLMPVFWLLFKYGHALRARSKYANRYAS